MNKVMTLNLCLFGCSYVLVCNSFVVCESVFVSVFCILGGVFCCMCVFVVVVCGLCLCVFLLECFCVCFCVCVSVRGWGWVCRRGKG